MKKHLLLLSLAASAVLADTFTLGEINVTPLEPTVSSGSAEAGYKVEKLNGVGVLGEMELQDTPYSINVMPQELIENLQASMPDSLFKVNTSTLINQPQARGNQPYVMMRGFKVDNFQTRENGILMGSSMSNVEDKERVEFLSGLSGFLYGPAYPGGTIDYVLKSPTFTPLNNITLGTYGGSTYYAHGDFGGPIYKDKLAYRLNLVGHEGDTAVDFQNVKRYLASGAIDWHISDNLRLQLDASYHDYKINGTLPAWTFSSGATHTSIPDTNKLWAQKYGFTSEERKKVGMNLTWDLNDIFTFRTGLGYQILTREGIIFTNTVATNNGNYTEKATIWAPWEYDVKAGYAAVDSQFNTGSIAHKMTVGFFGRNHTLKEYQDTASVITIPGSFSFSDPLYVTEPAHSEGKRNFVDSGLTENMNFIIGDTIAINDSLSLLLGANHAQIETKTYDRENGATKASYKKDAWVPNLSLIYKVIPQVSTYFTYTEGLEKGGTAGSTVANKGETMAPMLSKQYELGAKATVGGTLLTMALFDIDKAFEYIDPTDNIYKQDGREEHKGIEFSATGRATSNLTILGGFTSMQAKVIKNASNKSLEGKTPVDVAEQFAKLYVEYDVDELPGLTLTGGAYYTGKQAADTMNSEYLPSVVTGDIGARYRFKFYQNYPAVLRLNVTNVTNKAYWLNSSYTGDPINALASVQFKF